jgi:hypothetical protein
MVSTPRSLSKIIAGARFVHHANRACSAFFNPLVDMPAELLLDCSIHERSVHTIATC